MESAFAFGSDADVDMDVDADAAEESSLEAGSSAADEGFRASVLARSESGEFVCVFWLFWDCRGIGSVCSGVSGCSVLPVSGRRTVRGFDNS